VGRLRALAHRAGRRGAFLAFLAVLDLAYGYSLFTTAAPQRAFDLLAPWQAWGAAWIAVGAACAAGIFIRRDRLAFTAAATLKGAWGLVFADIWLVQGDPRGWVSVAVWLAFAAAVLIIAGWPEAATAKDGPPPQPPHPPGVP
jgi:hypothetical protein